MHNKSLFIGLGGIGKSKFNKMIPDATNEAGKTDYLIIDCSKTKDIDLNSSEINTEESTDE